MRAFAAVVLIAAAIAVGALVAVPLWPVPMTLQSLAVVLGGALWGPIVGVAGVALYVAAGAAGLPVFAGGKAGMAALTGPTGGFIAMFLVAAAMMGIATAKGRMRTFGGACLWAVAAHLLMLAGGGAWLALHVGTERALAAGVLPFLPGAVVKSVLAALILRAAAHRRPIAS